MNPSYFLRDVLQLAIIIPATLFAVLPLVETFNPKVYAAVLAVLILVCLAGAYACEMYRVPFMYVFAVVWAVLFAGYMSLMRGSVTQKLFCFFNSTSLCEFCSICANYLTAHYGLMAMANAADDFMLLIPSLAYLGMSLPVGLLFWHNLTVELPLLINDERMLSVWRYMFVLPLSMTLFVWWMTPISPAVVLTGRVRQIGFVLIILVMCMVLMFGHMVWWLTTQLTESARLQQENTFLQMEAKRYAELKEYMNHTKTLRHDFRQHILVIQHLAECEQLGELKEYLADLTDRAARTYENYCANRAVDAIASHYSHIAQDTRINWRLELPEVLPLRESDFCAMLGNLVENALKAVKTLPAEYRKVNVISSMLSKFMLGLSVDNPFSGKIELGKDGLPISSEEGHGTGLISVMNTVKRYGGTMDITAENGIFSVNIILYCNT